MEQKLTLSSRIARKCGLVIGLGWNEGCIDELSNLGTFQESLKNLKFQYQMKSSQKKEDTLSQGKQVEPTSVLSQGTAKLEGSKIYKWHCFDCFQH